jgi:hypothetical protein
LLSQQESRCNRDCLLLARRSRLWRVAGAQSIGSLARISHFSGSGLRQRARLQPLSFILTNTFQDPLIDTIPLYPITPDPDPPITTTIDITLVRNATGSFVWEMNGSSFRANYNNPILLLSNVGNNSYPYDPEWNVYNFGSNSSIRIVINNPLPLTHPIHLHGHNMHVLNEGLGAWDGTIVNANNTQRRDVQLLQGAGYIVIQIEADNPGAWPLHCHIAWHVSAGLYVTVLERPDDIAQLTIPSIMAQTCRDWSAFTNTSIPDQIDSGL